MTDNESLIPKHGGYRKLKSFQIAQLIYDITVRFCDRYIDKRSRTHDQMVQAARSGVQNIAEGSQASGTSKKMELKLTNVARASLEELRLDYEDFLRQRELEVLPPEHHVLMRFKRKRCATLKEVQTWIAEELDRQSTNRHQLARTEEIKLKGCQSVPVSESLSSSVLAANAALSLINLATYLLDRLLAAQAKAFESEGGFTERLYRTRSEKRSSRPDSSGQSPQTP
ncbi:MAG: four helix bundle suffix domain-containing protein [Candidatus Neomarinimicrobiota bacterium]